MLEDAQAAEDEALEAYDKAVLRFWNGSSEDVDGGSESDSLALRILKSINSMTGRPTYHPRNWNEIVAPARADLVRAVEARVRLAESARIEALKNALVWALGDIADRAEADTPEDQPDDPYPTPDHECGYFDDPEGGVCSYHDQWADVVALADEGGSDGA